MDFMFLCVLYTVFLHVIRNGKVEGTGQLRSSISIINPIFENLKIKEDAILSYEKKDKIRCTILCKEKTNCISVSYNKETQLCSLFDKDFTDISTTGHEVEAGWQYLHVIKDSEQRGGDCFGQGLPDICSLYCLSYITRPAPVLFAELAGICESYSGGELVKIDRGLKQYCVKQLLETESNGEVFIQGKRNESDNIWRFDDGTEMTYFNWNTAQGQPNDGAGEIYVGVRKSRGYVWHDLYETNMRAAVCQQT